MKVLIFDPRETVYDGFARQVLLPVSDGQWCVMDFHQPFVVALAAGAVLVDDVAPVNVRAGVARMNGNELVILTVR